MGQPVVSEPRKELVGGGTNEKYVKECTELFLANRGIEKLRGFESFVRLEALWLNGNKLQKINNLDNNFRIKVLNAQDNQICTLKGSLLLFTFLEHLDLSNNCLRNLQKQLATLEKFAFLKDLNLKGNPLCEEPEYRLLVIHAIPSLKVLDQHAVTPAERVKTKGLIGGDVATLTVAFGKRMPPYNAALHEKTPEKSVLERELNVEAEAVKDKLRHEAYMKDREMFLRDPHPAPSTQGKGLPPNAGTARAVEMWQTQADATRSGHAPDNSYLSTSMPAGSAGSTSSGVPGQQAASSSGRGAVHGLGSSQLGSRACGGTPNAESNLDAYCAQDKLVLYSLRPGKTHLAGLGTTLTQPSHGSIRFEQDKYDTFVRTKTAGQGSWELEKKTVKL